MQFRRRVTFRQGPTVGMGLTGRWLKSWVRLITPRKPVQMAELRLRIEQNLSVGVITSAAPRSPGGHEPAAPSRGGRE